MRPELVVGENFIKDNLDKVDVARNRDSLKNQDLKILKTKQLGMSKEITINQKDNELLSNIIKLFQDKKSCNDLFQNLKLDNEEVFDQWPYVSLIKFKLDRRLVEQKLNKIKFIKSFNVIKGEIYNYLLLKTIEYTKKLFVLDIEQG